MSTYIFTGALPQSATYIGEFVPTDMTVQYSYRVIAYDRTRNPITDTGDTPVSAWGTEVLDGNHSISIKWSIVVGASFYIVYKAINGVPPSTEQPPSNIWYIASASETEILDVGYPEATRNCWLNPGLSPVYPVGCFDGVNPTVATNVPPVGMAPADDGHQGGGFVRTSTIVTTMMLEVDVAQTPWTSDIDAADHNLCDVGKIETESLYAYYINATRVDTTYIHVDGNVDVNGCVVINPIPTTGPAMGPMYICLDAAGDMQISDKNNNGLVWITQTGEVSIGNPNPDAKFEVVNQLASGHGIVSKRYTDDAIAPEIFMAKARGTLAAPLTVQVGDFVGYISMAGFTTPGAVPATPDGVTIEAVVTGVTATDTAVDFLVGTNPGNLANNGNTVERFRITAAGNFIFHNLPTAATGLASGTIWNNGGVVNVVP